MGTLPRQGDRKLYEPRGALWVSLEFQGIPTHIINTHLSIWPKERMLQVAELLSKQWLDLQDQKEPLILCGDFNATPGSPAYNRICRRLKDSQTALAGHHPQRTWLGRYPLTQIDYIFVDPEFQIHSIAVPRTALEKTASDHLPLIAEMSCSYFSALSNY